jgi:hypothetical protein
MSHAPTTPHNEPVPDGLRIGRYTLSNHVSEVSLWQVLAQFACRLTFGVALAMAVTPPRLVTAGFYRIHLWVLLGVNTFAALVVYSFHDRFVHLLADWKLLLGLGIALAAASYLGSVIWLYEAARAGTTVLFGIAVLGLVAGATATPWDPQMTQTGIALALLDLLAGGLLLGVTMAGMFLGHWYLNTPTMELVPLRRLVVLMIVAIALRSLVSGTGLVAVISSGPTLPAVFWIFIGFRWLSGILGTLCMAIMAWYTLKVPNTQSATGILYAGVILAFLGELVSQLLSVGLLYPV